MHFIQCDALAIAGLADFSAVVTDPPYHRSTASNSPVKGRLGCPEFSNERLLELADRLTVADAALVVTTNYPNGAELHALSKGGPWTWRCTQVWDKRPTRTWVAWSRPLKCAEYIHYYTKGKYKLCFKDGTVKEGVKRSSFGGKLKASQPNKAKVSYGMYEEIVALPNPRSKVHPTQKPLSMSQMLVRVIGDVRVVDPFCGSGALVSAFTDATGIDVEDWPKV